MDGDVGRRVGRRFRRHRSRDPARAGPLPANFVILLKRLLTDPRVPRKSKLVLGATVVYLVSPIAWSRISSPAWAAGRRGHRPARPAQHLNRVDEAGGDRHWREGGRDPHGARGTVRRGPSAPGKWGEPRCESPLLRVLPAGGILHVGPETPSMIRRMTGFGRGKRFSRGIGSRSRSSPSTIASSISTSGCRERSRT